MKFSPHSDMASQRVKQIFFDDISIILLLVNLNDLTKNSYMSIEICFHGANGVR